MKLKVMRPLVSRALLAVLLVSLLPVQLVPAAQSQPQQQSQKRGKNGGNRDDSSQHSDSSSAEKTAAPSVQDAPNVPNETSASNAPVASHLTSESPAPQQANQSPAKPDDQTDSDQPNSRPRRREPPPFDRPPLKPGQNQGTNSSASGSSNSGRQDSDGQGSDRQRGDRTQTTQKGPSRSQQDGGYSPAPDTRSRSDRSNDDYDQDDASVDRSGRQRPVLRGETDSRNGQGGPPVLRKPSDQEAPESSGSSRGRNGGSAGQGETQGAGDDGVVRLESTLVNIPLLVSDRSGRYIPQLTKRDFLLWEDGKPQEIASFGSEEVPFKVALLLDVSPSVQGSIRDIQDAAIEFVRQLRTQDEVMVVSFDHNAHFLCDFTNNRTQLESAIRSASMGSGTSVYETVYEVVARRLRGVEGRKALILFSDGEDTTSRRVGYDDAVNVVTESDVLVYGLRYPGNNGFQRTWPWPGRRNPYPQVPNIPNIPLPWPWPRRRGPIFHALPQATGSYAVPGQSWPRRRGGGDFMADITAAGGGPVFDAQSVSDMRGLAARIAEELRHVYVISYYPTNPLSNGGYRTIRVQVRNRGDIAVRHRRGYNASSSPNVH